MDTLKAVAAAVWRKASSLFDPIGDTIREKLQALNQQFQVTLDDIQRQPMSVETGSPSTMAPEPATAPTPPTSAPVQSRQPVPVSSPYNSYSRPAHQGYPQQPYVRPQGYPAQQPYGQPMQGYPVYPVGYPR